MTLIEDSRLKAVVLEKLSNFKQYIPSETLQWCTCLLLKAETEHSTGQRGTLNRTQGQL